MAKYALIRDDDISFFASPHLLEQLYEEIFEAGIPVNFSVIPRVKVNFSIGKNIYSQRGFEYEPFIPSDYRGTKRSFFIHENPELVEFIQNSKEFIEVVQHGFHHTPNEFASINRNEIKFKIYQGKRILKKTFGHEPKFFCAPNDKYSPVSLMELQKHFCGVTYGVFSLRNMLSLWHGTRLPLNLIPPYLNALVKNDIFLTKNAFLVLGQKDFLINPFVDPVQMKQYFKQAFEDNRLINITQHYWEYYFRENQNQVTSSINKKLLDAFLEIVQELKAQNTKFLTMSQFYKKILR
jgi:peptidoglycan/xylan/chitin deacetylase (PgdA/CDA1 family)